MSVAGLGEIAGALKGSVSKHTGEMLSIFMTSIDDSAVEVSSNSIYALGLLLEGSPQDLSRYILLANGSNFSQYNSVLNKLQRFFADDAPINAKENAIGCVSRMILRHPQHIPLDLVVSSLPLILTLGSACHYSLFAPAGFRGKRTNLQHDNSTLPRSQSYHALAYGSINPTLGKSIDGGRSTSQDSDKDFFIRVSQSVKKRIPTVI
jgi:hypothetical protein